MYINENEIRIMSFNIRYENSYDGDNSWEKRKDYVCDLVRFHCPDIIGFQEPLKPQLGYLAKRLESYEWYGAARQDGKEEGEYAPIFYAADKFRLLDKGQFWLSETPNDPGSIGWDAALPRIATWVLLRYKDEDFYVFNTHLDHEGVQAAIEGSRLICEKIKEIAQDKPAILMGDFNHFPNSETYQTVVKGGLTDASSLVPLYGGKTTFHGFRALPIFYENRIMHNDENSNELTTIDYIFVKNIDTVVRHGILTDNINGFYPSDHMPKVCDILLS